MSRDLVCFSHLRWDFVYQRPNHLMARAAADHRVFFVEEPVREPVTTPGLRTAVRAGVTVVTPVLPETLPDATTDDVLAGLVQRVFRVAGIRRPILWYYTPMALAWTRELEGAVTVYDSMDHLAGFAGAPPALLELEEELLRRADLVFCGGASLHGRMAGRHPDAHCFPSSVDVNHFAAARGHDTDPDDQSGIARPRLGYAGVIDERIDLELVGAVASARPDVQVVLVGPIAKIDRAAIPDRPNIHLLGMKAYAELPGYLAGWDIGWMPFARNDATRYISPTKTPEYLAAGLPVISTSIHDVVEPYGQEGLVAIADTLDDTLTSIDAMLAGQRPSLEQVDTFLASRSWDQTWNGMAELVEEHLRDRSLPARRRLRERVVAARAGRARPAVAAAATVRPGVAAAADRAAPTITHRGFATGSPASRRAPSARPSSGAPRRTADIAAIVKRPSLRPAPSSAPRTPTAATGSSSISSASTTMSSSAATSSSTAGRAGKAG